MNSMAWAREPFNVPQILIRNYDLMLSPEQKIIEILKSYSSHSPLRREDLLIKLRDAGITLSDRKMRDIVARMVIDGHEPIGSNDEGYFYIHSEEDLREAKKELEAKAASIAVRRNCLERNFQESRNPQGDFL